MTIDPRPLADRLAPLDAISSPALVVDLDAVAHNVDAVIASLGDPRRWMPHVKTTKAPWIWRVLLDRGVRAFKCATTLEAEGLLTLADTIAATDDDAGAGAGDAVIEVLLAHHLRGPERTRLVDLARAHPRHRVSILVESVDDVAATPLPLEPVLDIDGGMHRTGVPAEDTARIVAIARAAGARLRTVHWYDGHVAALTESVRRETIRRDAARIAALVDELRAAGAPIDRVVTSGTPGFLAAARHVPAALARCRDGAPDHRVSPGTVVLHDARSAETIPELAPLGLRPAAFIFTRIASRPDDARATLDAGSKSLATDAGTPVAFIPDAPDALVGTPSEEHLPLTFPHEDAPAAGSPFFVIPRHVCPTVNLATHAIVLESGRAPRIEAIAARAHRVSIAGDAW